MNKPSTLAGEVEIRDVPAMTLCGLEKSFNMKTRVQGIPALWDSFNRVIDEVVGRTGSETYGVCMSEEGSGMPLRYAAAVQVEPGVSQAEKFRVIDLVAGKYAIFTHRGSNLAIKDTMDYIWSVWLPNNGEWQFRPAPDLEFYGERFDPASLSGEMNIYVPVQRIEEQLVQDSE